MGLYRGNKLYYAGNVGGGFNRKSLAQTFHCWKNTKPNGRLLPKGTQPNERVQWLEPKLVGEVKFAEWTADHRMRQPIFMGLRDDKDPKQVRFEHEQETKHEVAKAEQADRAADERRSKSKRAASPAP